MKLYTFFRSSAAFRVRIALNLKGLQYESIAKALMKNEHRTAEYLALNPQGLVPALAVDGTVLAQSMAIIEYLDETYPTPPLLPADTIQRAQVRAMTQSIACDIHPLNNLRVLNYLRDHMQQNEDAINTWYRHWIAEGFRSLEVQAAATSKSKKFLYGDTVTIADVLLVPQMFNARRFKTDLSPFPTLVAISTHLESLPAFAAARPEAQADAV